MKTLNENYTRNIAIMRENLKRGLTHEQANKVIDGMERQFTTANLYDDEAKKFVNAMRAEVIEHFTHIRIVMN